MHKVSNEPIGGHPECHTFFGLTPVAIGLADAEKCSERANVKCFKIEIWNKM